MILSDANFRCDSTETHTTIKKAEETFTGGKSKCHMYKVWIKNMMKTYDWSIRKVKNEGKH